MSFFNKAKCFVGIHDWSPWRYKADGRCEQTRTCARCVKSDEQVAHDFPGFVYTTPDKCDQSHTCRRCGEVETRIEHEKWSDWVYTQPDNCNQEHACPRCHEHETRTEHVWGPWQAVSSTSCDQVQYCSRCRQQGEIHPAQDQNHQWQGEHRVNCHEAQNVCARCHAAKSHGGEFHRFSVWGQANPTTKPQRQCMDCGKIEVQG